MKKLLKKSVAVVMTVIMLLTAAPLVGMDSLFAPEAQAKAISDYAVGDIIEFGSYPQSEVTDSALLSSLNSLSLNWASYGYYSGTGDLDDGQMKPGDFMKYADVTYGSAKYRAVKFTQYRPYTDFTCSADNSYQDDNGYTTGNIYWFKYEPLQWRVLDPAEGFILCENAIDAQAYSNVLYYNASASSDSKYCYFNSTACTSYASDYETSSIREWLNDDFYNTAFTSAEKAQIGTTTLDNSCWLSSYPLLDSAATNDKIFLLSYSEVKNTSYGFSSGTGDSSTRYAKPTAYAKAQGVYVDSSYGTSSWWLRSPGYDSYCASGVSRYGGVSSYYYVTLTLGIRPALKFNPNSEISESKYSQAHTVSNYKAENKVYASKYFAGAAQPMDGSNGTADLCIPGLSLGENMVPQGIAYYPAKNWLLISSYYKDAETDSYPCYIYALDFDTGNMVAEYKIKDSDGSTFAAHVGGIAISDYNLYITGEDADICKVSLTQLDKQSGEIVIEDKTSMSDWLGDANTAYLSINDGMLITGNFFYANDSKYDTPAKAANSVILMQRLSGNSSVDEWNSVCNPAVTAVIKVPDSVDRIQGVVYRDKKFYISSSFGRKNESKLYIADLSGSTLKNISEFKALPMMEGITFVGDYIYSVHESASAFYLNGLDGKGKSTKPTDVVWRIAYKELIYNMGDETYSFDNYSDDDSRGHCFGMSMTSAGYFLDILDINAIGGNKQDGIFALPENSKVKEPVCYYQNIQAKYAQNAIVAGGWYYKNGFPFISYDWNDVVNYVDNHEYDNKGTLQIGYRQGKSGHAINFLRYEVVNGQERIYAYDNNFPDTEVYFYKAANGDILQAPYATFDGAIDCIALRSVEKYFNSLGDYNATRYIYANKDDITIPGSEVYLVDCGTVSKERVVFEIPEGKEKVTIIPLVEDAEFEYLDVTYSFDQAEAGQVGEFTLAQDEDTADETVKLTFIDFSQKIVIIPPSKTTINYGDTLVLQLEEIEIPEGYAVKWFVEGAGVSTKVNADGTECRVTSISNGNATIYAKLVDEEGEPVTNADGEEIFDEITITSKAGFWQKFVSFFKNLFGINRVIY